MSTTNGNLHIERGVALRAYNTFGLPAVAHTLVRVGSDAEVRRVVDHPELGRAPKLVLGAGSNLILSRDPDGGERCVACYLCAIACPVDCIALQEIGRAHV